MKNFIAAKGSRRLPCAEAGTQPWLPNILIEGTRGGKRKKGVWGPSRRVIEVEKDLGASDQPQNRSCAITGIYQETAGGAYLDSQKGETVTLLSPVC